MIIFKFCNSVFLFQTAELSKDENNLRTESKPIAAQIQPTNNAEIIQVKYFTVLYKAIYCETNSNKYLQIF